MSARTLALLALASLAAAASFVLAGWFSEVPFAKVESVSRNGVMYQCEATPTPSRCGPGPGPTWPTAGAVICAGIAVALLLAAAWARRIAQQKKVP